LGSDEPERRGGRRAGCVLQLQYRSASHLLVSYCTNLSRGGLFVPSQQPLAPGTRLVVTLDVPGVPEPAEIEAEVRWVRGFDSLEGPAGMGLQFDGIDGLLGKRIDDLVSRFQPLHVDLVGERSERLDHIAAVVRSLVTCETQHHGLRAELADRLVDSDLVIIDLSSRPETALMLLRELSLKVVAPPRLALCPEAETDLRNRAVRWARVVPVPIDAEDLNACVLETVAQVEATR
jgi:uncharacterized protein (TIGR02266 family)